MALIVFVGELTANALSPLSGNADGRQLHKTGHSDDALRILGCFPARCMPHRVLVS